MSKEYTRQEEMPVKRRRKKKGHAGAFLRLFIIVVLLGVLFAVYFMQMQRPISVVKDYMSKVQAMDTEGMKGFLVNDDISALDEAGVTNSVFTNFFSLLNSKMKFSLSKNRFHIASGTADVTMKIKYIDATNIMKEGLSEFAKELATQTYAGTQFDEASIEQLLADILYDKATTLVDEYTTEKVTYHLEKSQGTWKISALDSDTVRIMSGNFTNLQDELNESLVSMQTASGEEGEQAAADPGTIDLVTDGFTIHYTSYEVSTDYSGNPCLLFYYDYTNNGSEASSAYTDVSLSASQNGQELYAAIPQDMTLIDSYAAACAPGQTLNVCQCFTLVDSSDVTLSACEAYNLDNPTTVTQVLTIQ